MRRYLPIVMTVFETFIIFWLFSAKLVSYPHGFLGTAPSTRIEVYTAGFLLLLITSTLVLSPIFLKYAKGLSELLHTIKLVFYISLIFLVLNFGDYWIVMRIIHITYLLIGLLITITNFYHQRKIIVNK